MTCKFKKITITSNRKLFVDVSVTNSLLVSLVDKSGTGSEHPVIHDGYVMAGLLELSRKMSVIQSVVHFSIWGSQQIGMKIHCMWVRLESAACLSLHTLVVFSLHHASPSGSPGQWQSWSVAVLVSGSIGHWQSWSLAVMVIGSPGQWQSRSMAVMVTGSHSQWQS